MKKRFFAFFTMAMFAMMSLVSCGGGDDDGTPMGGTPEGTPGGTPEETPGGSAPEYFAITALEDEGANVRLTYHDTPGCPEVHLLYSLNGKTWDKVVAETPIHINKGEKLMMKADEGGNKAFYHNSGIGGGYSIVTETYSQRIKVSGNIMTLLNGDNPAVELTDANDFAFAQIFNNCSGLVSAAELKLPATKLSRACYDGMFNFCSDLVEGPAELPATTLAEFCYSGMFWYCVNLVKVPKLPVTQLADNCYTYMFYVCKSLKAAPELPATEMKKGCYECMFERCESLESAPALPATKLAESCYKEMFKGCTLLDKAPALPATELQKNCYMGMFQDCNITAAPKLPAKKLADYCYSNMFYNCKKLFSVTMEATDVSALNCLSYWLPTSSEITSPKLYVPSSMVSDPKIVGDKGVFTVAAM